MSDAYTKLKTAYANTSLKLKTAYANTSPNLLKELIFMFPDSILYGSFLLSLITVSYQHTIFFISILESLLILYGIQSITSFLYGSSISANLCKPMLYKHTFEHIFIRPSANNPSYGVYLITFAAAYLLSSFINLKDELEALSTDKYMRQYNISVGSIVCFILLYLFLRLINNCEAAPNAIMGLLFGAIIGYALISQNVLLFGKESINFLGIPLLRNKTESGEPIYICT
jgi:hypothetical protein